MNYDAVLKKIECGELDADQAYNQLFVPSIKEGGKRAFFVKMNLEVPEEGKKINTFFKILFMIPIPLLFIRIPLRLFKHKIENSIGDANFEIDDIIQMIKYSRNTRVQIDSSDAKIDIKVI